ncbi:MAG: BtpA/SgcQ family protein, partial [Candidatus Eisenbacteria bacterium]|nr:BtpA/SgcQ family protein [Candidatus Eisenbacteria bacterium]
MLRSGPAPLFTRPPVLIGMIHLEPLPGSPRFGGSMARVVEAAARDAEVLAGEGYDGLLLENFGDAPFHPDDAPPETIAAMSWVLSELRRSVRTKAAWGVNVLRNDARAALG